MNTTSAPRPGPLLWLGVSVLTLFTAFLLFRYGSPGLIFVPAALFAVPLLALRMLDRPVLVLSLFLIAVVNLDFVKLGGAGLSLDILSSSALMWAMLVRLGLSRTLAFRHPIERAAVLFLLVTSISVVLSVSMGNSIKNWIRDLQYLLLFVFLTSMALDRSQVRALVGAVVGSSLIPCLLGLLGVALGIDALYGLDTPIGGGETVRRIQSTLSHPGTLANYLAFVGVLTLSLILAGDGWPRRYLVPLFGLQMFVLYGTFGRTGWGEFMVGALALLWITRRRRVLLLGVPVLAVALIQFVPTFLARWSTVTQAGNENSLLWRIGLWAYSLTLVPARPFFGSGQDTFIEYVAYDTGFAAHQTWVGLLVETGAVGLAAFVILLVVVGRELGKARSRVDPAEPISAAVVAAFVGFLAGSFVGDPWGLPSVAIYFWVMVALAVHPSLQRIRGNSVS